MSTESPGAPVHYLRGGSNSNRIVSCPASCIEAAKWPARPSGAAAIDGTHTHTLVETSAGAGCWDATRYVGQVLNDHEGSFTVDRDRAVRANAMLEYIAHRLQVLPNAKLQLELFVEAGTLFGIPQWGGSADVVFIWPTGAGTWGVEIADYKDGYVKVSPDGFQNVTYGTGIINTLDGAPITSFRSTIVQPKVSRDPWFIDYTPEEFYRKQQVLVQAMLDSCSASPSYNAGKHCKWCPGAMPGRCAAFNDKVTNTMSKVFDQIPPSPQQQYVPPAFEEQPPGTIQEVPVEPQAQTTPAIQTSPLGLSIPVVDERIDDEELRQILDAEPLVIQWLKEAKAEALRRVQAGAKIPTYKMVHAPTREKWGLQGDELVKKLRGMGLKKEEYIVERVTTPKQVKGCEAVKSWSERKVKNLHALIEKPEGELRLVPESDPGVPVEVVPQEVFDSLPRQEPDTTTPEHPQLSFF